MLLQRIGSQSHGQPMRRHLKPDKLAYTPSQSPNPSLCVRSPLYIIYYIYIYISKYYIAKPKPKPQTKLQPLCREGILEAPGAADENLKPKRPGNDEAAVKCAVCRTRSQSVSPNCCQEALAEDTHGAKKSKPKAKAGSEEVGLTCVVILSEILDFQLHESIGRQEESQEA